MSGGPTPGYSREGFLTTKQYQILTVLVHGNKDINENFTPCDIDELLERLCYRTTKESMQFSIRALIKRDLLIKGREKRRGARRTTLLPTRLARHVMGETDISYLEKEGICLDEGL